MRALLSSNPYRDKGLRTAIEAREILKSHGAEVIICLPFQLKKGERLQLPPHILLGTQEVELPHSDVLICFGGDGTLLHAARDAVRFDLPVLGVNMGSVGFMAELERGELSVLKRLAQGDYYTENRMMLKVKHFRGDYLLSEELALNDAVVSKGSMARVAEMEVFANDHQVTSLMGDGVIFATPTGSTAYSMSAGGSIVDPEAKCILMTPVCPHQLGSRPMILPPERTITVKLPRNSKKYLYLAVDGGKPYRITGADRVEITQAEEETKLIRLTKRSFYDILHHKLGGRSG